MLKRLKRHAIHLAFWGGLAFYLLLANSIYTHFFIKNGKPESVALQLPPVTHAIVYNLVEMRPVVVQGESVYELRGFAFLQASPLQLNKITIILNRYGKNYAFSTSPEQYPDMIESYSGYQPGMEKAEFDMLISKDILSPGIYHVGVLLENLTGPGQTYTLTNCIIQQTANTINFIPEQ